MTASVRKELSYLNPHHHFYHIQAFSFSELCPLFRTVRSFLMVWGLSKNVNHHGWLTTKNFKITLAKTSQNNPRKQNLDPEINNSKLHTWILSFSFRFSGRKSWSQQKQAEKVTHFTILKKHFTHFPNFDSLNIVKNILPRQN